jgi:hypothetical protein
MMDLDYDKLCLGCFRETEGRPCPQCGFDPAAPPAFPLALEPGEILAGRYLVGRPLGQGGFGITYLALDLTLQIKVAVKEYLPAGLVSRDTARGSSLVLLSSRQEGDFETNKQKFLDEARILAQLADTPNIVKVQNFFLENNTAYFTMEYVDGMSLKDVVASAGGRLPFDRAAALLAPVAGALERVHARGLLHRDISPDNVCVTAAGEPKLLDFGAARFALGEEQSLSVILKHGFAPEEQYRTHGRQGPWTDLYALAATFYWCLTGERPPDAIDRLHQDRLVPPSALGVALPPAAEAALVRALAVRAEHRFASMAQFVAALRGGALGPSGAPTVPSGPPTVQTAALPGPPSAFGLPGPPASTSPLTSGPCPQALLGPGLLQPVGAPYVPKRSVWARLTGSPGALVATGLGAAVVLAGIVVGIVLLTDTAGGGSATGGGGGGGGGNPPTPIASPSGDAPPTPEPTPGPTGPTPDVPDGWYHSDAMGFGFEVPADWTVSEEEDAVTLFCPDQTCGAAVAFEAGVDKVSLMADPDPQMEDIRVNTGMARYEYITDEYRFGLGDDGDLLWWELSFALYDDAGELYPVQLYATDVAAIHPGTYVVCMYSTPATGAGPYTDIEELVASFRVD